MDEGLTRPRGARPPLLALLAAAPLLTACVTTSALLDARGTGTARCYRMPYDSLWPVVDRSIRWAGLVIENANRDGGFFLARNYEPEVEAPEDMALDADQGERVAVFLDREGSNVWAVEVVSRPAFALDVTPRDWTVPIFTSLEDRLPEAATEPGDDLAACTRAVSFREPPPER